MWFIVSTLAQAAPTADISTIITPPVGAYVYATARWNVKITNTGTSTATGNTVDITLPLTATSPTSYVLGTVGALGPGCTLTSNVIKCTTANLKKNKSATVWFDYAIPLNAGPVTISAHGDTVTAESSETNNDATSTPTLLTYNVTDFTGSADVHIDHCTGTGLGSFFECECFPSSISSHETTLNADGSITFAPEVGPEYTGSWWSDSANHLAFTYYELGVEVAFFEGYGVSANCWEGETVFTPGPYMSMYQVCVL